MIVYCITHLETGKKYVGVTKHTLIRRLKAHKRVGTYLGNHIRKYGIQAFTIELIETCETLDKAFELEMYWIEKLDTLHPKGFNMNTGGCGRSSYKNHELTSLALSLAGRGRIVSKETREKISKSNKGRKGGVGLAGLLMSEETANKISKSLAKLSKEKVEYILSSYKRGSELSRELGISQSLISRIRSNPNGPISTKEGLWMK